jgi:hypothetical protein
MKGEREGKKEEVRRKSRSRKFEAGCGRKSKTEGYM